MPKKKIRLPTRDRMVNVLLVDSRELILKCHLAGMMRVPLAIMEVGVKVNWPVEEFKNSPKGLTIEARPESLTIAFPFLVDEDAETKRGAQLSFREIVDLFKRFEPRLKEIV